jgi:hypothetical protein
MRPTQYAQRASISRRACYDYVASGKFPSYKFHGVVLIDIDEADAAIRGLLVTRPVRQTTRSKQQKKAKATTNPNP